MATKNKKPAPATAGKKKRGRPPLSAATKAARATKKAQPAPDFKVRVSEYTAIKASELRADPRNFRTHPEPQKTALVGIIKEVGFTTPCLGRRDPDGKIVLIDGHCRAEIGVEFFGDPFLPVCILDVTESEAAKILITHDRITGLASIDNAKLDEVLKGCKFEASELSDLIAATWNEIDAVLSSSDESPAPENSETSGDSESKFGSELTQNDRFLVIIEVADELEQQTLIDEFDRRKLVCRASRM